MAHTSIPLLPSSPPPRGDTKSLNRHVHHHHDRDHCEATTRISQTDDDGSGVWRKPLLPMSGRRFAVLFLVFTLGFLAATAILTIGVTHAVSTAEYGLDVTVLMSLERVRGDLAVGLGGVWVVCMGLGVVAWGDGMGRRVVGGEGLEEGGCLAGGGEEGVGDEMEVWAWKLGG